MARESAVPRSSPGIGEHQHMVKLESTADVGDRGNREADTTIDIYESTGLKISRLCL